MLVPSVRDDQSRMKYYIYYVRAEWQSNAMKIGHNVGDIAKIRRRYQTPYGSNCDIGVFEVDDKKQACKVEHAIQAVLTAAGYHISREIFQVAAVDLFSTTAALLCKNHVSLNRPDPNLSEIEIRKETKRKKRNQNAEKLLEKKKRARKAAKLRAKKDAALLKLAISVHQRKSRMFGKQSVIEKFAQSGQVLYDSGHYVKLADLRAAVPMSHCPTEILKKVFEHRGARFVGKQRRWCNECGKVVHTQWIEGVCLANTN